MTLIVGEKLVKQYRKKSPHPFRKNYISAVNKVDISIETGQTLGLVGESGSGKSTLGELLGGLQAPTEGKVYYDDVDISTMNREAYRDFRRNVQFIFQSPQASMNPYYKIKNIMLEPMKTILPNYNPAKGKKTVEEMIHNIGLDTSYLEKYPTQLSGGQCQRVAIGRALLLKPKLVICDECVSALDVSVQAQILNLLKQLQEQFKMSYLFISHDIATVKYMSDMVSVMYRGNIVESGKTSEILKHPQNEYTKKLLTFTKLKNA